MNDEEGREPPWEDPIVAEVRAARVSLLTSAGYDLEKLAEHLRQEQAVPGRRVVTLSTRAPLRTPGEAA